MRALSHRLELLKLRPGWADATRSADFKSRRSRSCALRAQTRLSGTADMLLMRTKASNLRIVSRDQLRPLVEKTRRFEAGGLFREELLDRIMLAALAAERGFGVRRLQLREAAVRTIRADSFGLLRRVLVRHEWPGSPPAN